MTASVLCITLNETCCGGVQFKQSHGCTSVILQKSIPPLTFLYRKVHTGANIWKFMENRCSGNVDKICET